MNVLNELKKLWQNCMLDERCLQHLSLPKEPLSLASSFHVADAAQFSIAAAAAASNLIFGVRSGQYQQVTVSRRAAEMECTGYFNLDGVVPDQWEKFSGLYATGDGHVRVHANFSHHRDGILALLGLGPADTLQRSDVEQSLLKWSAQDFEDAAAERGLVVSKVRSFAEWDSHPHAHIARQRPLLEIYRIGDAQARPLPSLPTGARPLHGVRVLDLTRILAGPVAGRTLAAYGADVMLVNAPHLPNIASVIETSRGKRSVHLDLNRSDGQQRLRELLKDSHIFVQGYRPGGLQARGFGPADLAEIRPGIISVNLSAYGNAGPWAERRGFDSLVQTATGFNHAEAQAFGSAEPKALPVQILDYATGFLMAFGAQAALARQAQEGGSWQVDVSLLQTAYWLRGLGRCTDNLRVTPGQPPAAAVSDFLQPFACRAGTLHAIPHAATFSDTPVGWQRAAGLPGSDQPGWS